MMSGVLSPAFLQAAGRSGKGKKPGDSVIRLYFETEDPMIASVTTTSPIRIISHRGSEDIVQEIDSPISNTALNIVADPMTEICIYGDVVSIQCGSTIEGEWGPLNIGVCEVRIIAESTALETYYVSTHTGNNGNTTEINLDKCPNLKRISDGGTTIDNLSELNIGNCTSLESVGYIYASAISKIYYDASNLEVSNAIAELIDNATAYNGTVYTDSEGAYYSTIENAATAKGWTIEQL